MAVPDQPSGRRVLAAFVIAPFAPAFFIASLTALNGTGLGLFVLTFALAFGYFSTLIVGLPLYVLARKRLRATLPNCALAGAIVAVLPLAILALTTLSNARPIEIIQQLALVGLFGAAGGGVFWLVVRARTSDG